jgi:hypothetical protein
MHNLLMDGCPSHNPLDLHGFVDSDWAACLQMQHSFAGTCLCLAGGCIAYKTQLLPTVALSSRTEQLRKLGKLQNYYLDKFNQNGVFIRRKQ